MKKLLVPLLTGLVLALGAQAEPAPLVRGEERIDLPAMSPGLCLHNFFQSGMVLQRDKPIRVWGWAEPEAQVSVTLGENTQTTTAGKDRAWSVEFEPLPASHEGLSLTVSSSGQTIEHDDILVGDLWVLGGQSNMEFPISKVVNGQLEIVSANFPEIRILTIPNGISIEPKANFPLIYEWSDWSKQHFRKGYWDPCTPENVKQLSAIGYVFARRLNMASQIPIGVIDASVGGTTVEAWTPLDVLNQYGGPAAQSMLTEWQNKVESWDPQEDLKKRIARYESRLESFKEKGRSTEGMTAPTDLKPGPRYDRNHPGNCFASLIAPLEGIEVKGVIFHQGFNNCFNGSAGAKMYAEAFPLMIKSWRKNFNNPQMPFGILSLCTAGEKQDQQNFLEQLVDVGPYIREAQYRTYLDMKNSGDEQVGFVSTYDLSRRWYHPQLKVPAGERIARWALATQYGFDKELKWEPPVITEMTREEGALHLKFDKQVLNVDDGSYMKGFAIAGEDRLFQIAEISHLVTGKDNRGRPQYDRSVLVLSSPLVPQPLHYRYAWARNPMANIEVHHNSDIPLATQRSDDWDIEMVPLPENPDNPPSIRQLRKIMREKDQLRLEYEAKQLLDQSK